MMLRPLFLLFLVPGCAVLDAEHRLERERFDRVVVSNDGRWTVGVRPDTAPPLNEPFELLLAVEPTDGSRAGLAEVSIDVDCTMPQHGHGMNVLPEVERIGPGRFVVRGLEMFMEGGWLVTIDITLGPETERTQWWVEPK